MQPTPVAIQQSAELQRQLTGMRVDMWLKEDLFHANWWILIGLLCILIVSWILLLKKEGLAEACLYAAFATILSFIINEYGEELILWDFPTDIIPYFPPLTSVNLLILPLAFSILYQRFPTWKGFLWASLIASAAVSLAIDPLLAWARLYELVNWRYYFSLPVYWAIALITRLMTRKIDAVRARGIQQAGGA